MFFTPIGFRGYNDVSIAFRLLGLVAQSVKIKKMKIELNVSIAFRLLGLVALRLSTGTTGSSVRLNCLSAFRFSGTRRAAAK